MGGKKVENMVVESTCNMNVHFFAEKSTNVTFAFTSYTQISTLFVLTYVKTTLTAATVQRDSSQISG